VLFPAGSLPAVGGFAELAVRLVSDGFAIGVQMAAPFIVYGIVFYAGLGLLSRLMPQFQFFFVAMPLQIMAALVMLMVTLSAIMTWFLDYYEAGLSQLLAVR